MGYDRAMDLLTGTRFVQKRGVESRAIDDGAVLVDMGSGKVFELNRVGAEIWKLLASGTTLDGIYEALVPKYTVGRAVLESDVQKLVDSLIRAGLAFEDAGGNPSVTKR